MKLSVVTNNKNSASEIDLEETVFGLEPRQDILARVVTWQLARRQAGTHKTKERGDVRGTTKKMYRQKGTGGARHGSKRGAQFRGGGIIFGPVVRDHGYDLQKKVRKLGLKMALSAKVKSGNLIIVEDLSLENTKTQLALQHFAYLNGSSALLIDSDQVNGNMLKAIANLDKLDIMPQIGANVYDILRKDKVVLTVAAVKSLEARLK
ncbi:50S ribosomal protein L4 [Candidatus Finniella inopinata]|uniref:Large ribosomal subunit protein uL4 n=1 Tax=Candidatus Finniella inopinata TaxID=1696036 RepID=A0A4Q7DIX2_9PROT|nr:50S ribosomal protein L4 [Candidatus Finniella inopinata]RZI46248.1 50S ribosomal protein L4 [Candidatus Finniella inopinata]